MPDFTERNIARHLKGIHHEAVRQQLALVLYPVDENGNRLVDENGSEVKEFPKGHKGCRYSNGYTDFFVAEDLRKIDPEEYGYIKFSMITGARKKYFGKIIYPPKPKLVVESKPVVESDHGVNFTSPAFRAGIMNIFREAMDHFVGQLKDKLNNHADMIDRHTSTINNHAQKLTSQANRLDEHAKSIDSSVRIDQRHSQQINDLLRRVTELETNMMNMGKEAAELASSFHSLQARIGTVAPPTNAGAASVS